MPRRTLSSTSVPALGFSGGGPATRRGRPDIPTGMTNTLAAYALDSLKAKLCLVRLLSWFQLRHRQDQDAIPVGGIGEGAIDGVREDYLTVIRSYGPLRHEDFGLVATGATVSTMHGNPVASNLHRDVLRLEPRH